MQTHKAKRVSIIIEAVMQRLEQRIALLEQRLAKVEGDDAAPLTPKLPDARSPEATTPKAPPWAMGTGGSKTWCVQRPTETRKTSMK